MKLMAPINIAETCQACGAPLDTDSDWLCADCLEEDEDPRDAAFREPDCEQCGGPAKDGFCRVCQ